MEAQIHDTMAIVIESLNLLMIKYSNQLNKQELYTIFEELMNVIT